MRGCVQRYFSDTVFDFCYSVLRENTRTAMYLANGTNGVTVLQFLSSSLVLAGDYRLLFPVLLVSDIFQQNSTTNSTGSIGSRKF